MKEFLKKLGIDYPGEENEDLAYVVTLPDSDAYSKVFSILDKSPLVHDADTGSFDFDVIHYESENYLLDLYSDYDKDEYRLEVIQKDSELNL